MKALKFVSDGLSPGMAADEEVPVFAAPSIPIRNGCNSPPRPSSSILSALPSYLPRSADQNESRTAAR